MIIIGITGKIGAGKGTVVEYLREQRGFMHYSARTFITEEVKRRGMPVDRPSMNEVSNDLRSAHSPAYIIESLYKIAKERGEDCIIESIRTIGEIEALRKIGHFHLLAVTADLPIRYERILFRNSETDHVSFEEFADMDELESKSTDPNKQNVDACIREADLVLHNNGTVQELYKEIENFLKML